MTDFYVSADGDDSNSGTFASPWETLAKVNAALTAKHVYLKDRVLFRRGDTFYGKLRPVNDLQFAPDPGSVRFGAYGDDPDLPIISGYKVMNISGGWSLHASGVWKIDYATANAGTNYTGNAADTDEDDANIGFLKVDGQIKGVKRLTLAELEDQWDFYSTGTVLYIKSTANPTTLSDDLRASIRLTGIKLASRCSFSDLVVEGYGGHGFSGIALNDVMVRGCTSREIGGSYLPYGGGGVVRYGNGFEIFQDSQRVLVEHNTVSDVYDAAWTIQGGAPGDSRYFRDITWRRNLTYRCSQAEEYWCEGTGPGFVNCRSEYNTYLFSGYGWGADIRGDQDKRVGQQSYSWGYNGEEDPTREMDVAIKRNIYFDCYESFAFNLYPPLGQTSDYNAILLRPGTLMTGQSSVTIENAATWAASVGREENSQFVVLPASADTDISDADVTAALATLNSRVRMGQLMAIHGPWT